MTERNFDYAEQIGRTGEFVVAYHLRSLERMVCHHGGEGEQKFEGRKLITSLGNVILPDLSWFKMVGHKQQFFWADVKTKTYCTFNRHAGEWQTGCGLSALDQYRLVSAATQKLCFIFFLQLRSDSPEGRCPTGLFFASTAKLFCSKRAHFWRSNGMIYWDTAILDRAAGIEDLLRVPKCRHYLKKLYLIIGFDDRLPPENFDQ